MKTKRIISVLLCLLTAFCSVPFVSTGVQYSSIRLAGEDRYSTAAAISYESFETAQTVIIASGESFPDALAGAPLAMSLSAPILLTAPKDGLTAETMDEIYRLGAVRAIILGGLSAVSEVVEEQLITLGIEEVIRHSGENRFETAALINDSLFEPGAAIDTVFIATGKNYADALSISPVAGMTGSPILFTERAFLPDSTKNFILNHNIGQAVVIGGGSVINNTVLNELESIGLSKKTRIGGSDRIETSNLIAAQYEGLFGNNIAVATGYNFPDALAGGVIAAINQAPMILVSPQTRVQQGAKDIVAGLGSNSAFILGGTTAVPEQRVEELFGEFNVIVSKLTKEDGTGEIRLGMNRSQLLNIFKKYNVPYTETGPVITTDEKAEYMFRNNILAEVNMHFIGGVTNKGLKVGDTQKRMQEIYGSSYSRQVSSDCDTEIIKYTYGNTELRIITPKTGSKIIQEIAIISRLSVSTLTARGLNDQCAVKYTAPHGSVDKFIEVAMSQLGYREGDYNSKTGRVDFPGDKNWTKYGYWFSGNDKMGIDYAWCAFFVSWCANQAGLRTVPKYAFVSDGIRAFGSRYKTSITSKTPLRPGDVVFFGTAHTGICIKVYEDGSFDSIEGNACYQDNHPSEARLVAIKHHKLGDGYATGFGMVR